MTTPRQQINFLADDEVLEALSDIRRLAIGKRLPTISDAIRDAIFEKRDRLKRSERKRPNAR